ncbi:MAG: ATP-dependent protease subunit HslV [Firmicutes bacterium]|nr:ATP-dependent protease subunit HslV [Bacillota bacterium]
MKLEGTTIVGVKKDGKTVIAGDGQVTNQATYTVMKGNAVKVRRMYNESVVVGFAGSVADAFTLCDRFEEMLNKFSGNLMKSAVELAKSWRSDKFLRTLEALMIVADKERMLIISGDGNVFEPENGIAAIGSGGNYALAAARALVANTNLSAREICKKAMEITEEICVFTNKSVTIEEV